MKIDWMSLLIVAGVTVVAAAVVGIFSLGLAALTNGGNNGRAVGRKLPAATKAGAYACFAAAGLVVLYGLYLIVPQFHR